MQLEPALICSWRFLLFLHTKGHINLAESSDIALQHLDVAVLHHLPCKIVLPHWRWGQQELGREQMTEYTRRKYMESNRFIMMGVVWEEYLKICEQQQQQHFEIRLNRWIFLISLSEYHKKMLQLLSKCWGSFWCYANLLLFWHYMDSNYYMRYCVDVTCWINKAQNVNIVHSQKSSTGRCNKIFIWMCRFIGVPLNKNKNWSTGNYPQCLSHNIIVWV